MLLFMRPLLDTRSQAHGIIWALVLNYTNPIGMLICAVQEVSNTKITGLCHSVQATAAMLARWIGTPMEEITYFCADINHLGVG
jgi:alpha-galactosidase